MESPYNPLDEAAGRMCGVMTYFELSVLLGEILERRTSSRRLEEIVYEINKGFIALQMELENNNALVQEPEVLK
jgi:hypothetical protein